MTYITKSIFIGFYDPQNLGVDIKIMFLSLCQTEIYPNVVLSFVNGSHLENNMVDMTYICKSHLLISLALQAWMQMLLTEILSSYIWPVAILKNGYHSHLPQNLGWGILLEAVQMGHSNSMQNLTLIYIIKCTIWPIQGHNPLVYIHDISDYISMDAAVPELEFFRFFQIFMRSLWPNYLQRILTRQQQEPTFYRIQTFIYFLFR